MLQGRQAIQSGIRTIPMWAWLLALPYLTSGNLVFTAPESGTEVVLPKDIQVLVFLVLEFADLYQAC